MTNARTAATAARAFHDILTYRTIALSGAAVSALFYCKKYLTNAVKRYTVQFFTHVFTQYYLLIFSEYCAILYSEKNNYCLVRASVVFYNPTHLIRELCSESGLQTSRPGPLRLLRATDEGSVNPRAGTHLHECGFYSPHDGKAVIFFIKR